MAKKEEKPKEEPKPKALPKWRYVGKYPTWYAGRLIHPGNVVESKKKPGEDFKPFKP